MTGRGQQRLLCHDRSGYCHAVFLSHNSADRSAVEALARRLIEAVFTPWLDTWNLVGCVLARDRQIPTLCGKIGWIMLLYPKHLIEVALPIKRISAHARREKSIRRGHISALCIW